MKTKILHAIGYSILVVTCTVFAVVLGYILYVPKPMYPVILLLIYGVIAGAVTRKKLRTVFTIGSIVMSLLLPILSADGIFWGDRTELKGIFLRGLAKMSYDNRLKSDEDIFTSALTPQRFNDKGYRDSGLVAADGYSYRQYVYNGTVIEEYEKNTDDNKKAILYVHGGAYIGTLTDQFNAYIKAFCEETGGTKVYATDYKLAPDYSTMDFIGDVLNTYEKIKNDGYRPENITFAGDSAGGGLVLATCLYMRDELGMKKNELPGKVLTISAWTDLTLSSPSVTLNRKKDPTFGCNRVLEMSIEKLDIADLTNQYVSPIFAKDFSGLPQIYMQCANYESLRDDTVLFAEKALASGADVTFDIYPGMFHEFQMMKGTLKVSDRAWEKIIDFLR